MAKTNEELIEKFLLNKPYVDWGLDAKDGFRNDLRVLLTQKDAEVAIEKAYVNAYADFVDEMATETPFEVAFESLNERLGEIMDTPPKDTLTKDNL